MRPARPDLPSFSNVRRFAHPILSLCEPAATFSNFDGDIYASYDAWQKYKNEVPTRGAILLNPSRDKVLLVKGWKSSASWGFPKGKIDEHESDRDCAVREVSCRLCSVESRHWTDCVTAVHNLYRSGRKQATTYHLTLTLQGSRILPCLRIILHP